MVASKSLRTFLIVLITVVIVFIAYFYTATITPAFNQSENYRYYIQVRNIFENEGFQVEWNEETHSAIISNDYHNIILPANSKIAHVDDKNLDLEQNNLVLENKMLIAPSSYTKIIATIGPNNEGYSADDLWKKTVALHLQDDLWVEQNIYDAGHYLMIPLHASFERNEPEWQQQFAEQFSSFMANREDIDEGRLNQLHYYYLASRFIVLANDHSQTDLIPQDLPDYLYDRIISIWYDEPAWQWAQEDFPNMKERVHWKLNTPEPKRSYYRAIIDEELFTFAIAADLSKLYRDKDEDKFDNLAEILDTAYQVFNQEVQYTESGGWLFQPGVHSQHNDYAYAGNKYKAPNLSKKPIENIASDTSHSHRYPLWLKSLAEAYSPDSNEGVFYNQLRKGLAKQFTDIVLVEPTDDFPAYRTTNFMDGTNGVYRWNYATQGPNNGYGPYELSGTLLLGWWTFLPDVCIDDVYNDISSQFPLPDDVIELYVGPGTSRERHNLIVSSNPYVNGYIELISYLAGNIKDLSTED